MTDQEVGRPSGVTIIATLAWLEGLINIVGAIGYFFAVRIPYSEVSDQTTGLGLAVIGVIWLAIGYGFFMGLSWARMLGLIWSGIALLSAAWLIVTNIGDLSVILLPAIASIVLPGLDLVVPAEGGREVLLRRDDHHVEPESDVGSGRLNAELDDATLDLAGVRVVPRRASARSPAIRALSRQRRS